MSINQSKGSRKTIVVVGVLTACLLSWSMPAMAEDDAYPHITTLEKAILGKTFPADDLTARLSRMESKAFGKASKDSDLSQRTDDLEDYSQKTLHQKAFGAGSAYDVEQREAAGEAMPDADVSAPSSSSPPTEYPHITSLEKSILDQTFPGQPLPDRLARMEEKAFGKPAAGQDLSDRTDALEGYAQKTLHKKPFSQEQKQEAAAYGGVPVDAAARSAGGGGGGAGQSKLLNFVGNSLLGMAGGALMPGFGGVRMRPRMPQSAGQSGQPEPAVEVRPDDPSVNGAEPPPVGAKMQTQVGWCEVQLFGHTFPAMHLPDRLKQINTELNYAPGKTPIALMDDVGGLIKAVQAKKKGPTKPAI